MSIIHKCDRCGEILSKVDYKRTDYQVRIGETDLDLCPTCQKELNNFIDKHQMEVKVFCKDCEHMESIADISQFCNKFGGYVTDDDYCSRGKIREE